MSEGVFLDQESLKVLEMVACHQEVHSLVVREKGILVGGRGTGLTGENGLKLGKSFQQ